MTENFKTTRKDLLMIDPRNIVVEEGFNSRRDFALEDLVPSIKENGVLQPITVVKFKDENGNEKYRLVDGERRYRATMQALAEGAEIHRIPAMGITNLSGEEAYIQQLIRNEGKRFTDYENALAFAKLRDKFGFTITEIAKKVYNRDTKVGYISQCLALLELPTEVQEKLARNEISSTAVRDITNSTDNVTEQVKAVNDAVKTAKAKGKAKATVKDAENASVDVKVMNDSKAICKGIELLFEYADKICGDAGCHMDIEDVLAGLKEGKTIVQLFSDAVGVNVNYSQDMGTQMSTISEN